MVDYFLDVAICGVLILYDLYLSPSSVCGVRDEASLRVCGVAYGPNEVRSVVFRPVLWVEYIIWYGLRAVDGVLFVILEPLLTWMGYGL